MEEFFAALEQAFADYREDLDTYERKRKPTDGLLGFGRALKDDPCHDRLDQRVGQIVQEISKLRPSPEEAERAVGMLLSGNDQASWPLAAEWMLRAIERHSIPLISFLKPEAAASFLREYDGRYRPWDRLPAQKQVHRALKEKARTGTR